MKRGRGPSRGAGVLLCLLAVTAILACKLPEPFKALSIGLGVAAIVAEFSAIGFRVADGVLWLASQPFPKEASQQYRAWWRGDLRESVDGQGPISFSLDVLVSIPRSALSEWKALPKCPLTAREELAAARISLVVSFSSLVGVSVFDLTRSMIFGGIACVIVTASGAAVALIAGRMLTARSALLTISALILFFAAQGSDGALGYALWATAGVILATVLSLRILKNHRISAAATCLTLPPVIAVVGEANWIDYVGERWSYVLFLACAAPIIAMTVRITARILRRSTFFIYPAAWMWLLAVVIVFTQAGPRLAEVWIVAVLAVLTASVIGLLLEMRNPLVLTKANSLDSRKSWES